MLVVVFEGFSAPARQAVVSSQEHARSLGHDTVHPEHLLLALASGTGPSSRGLRGLGATPNALRPGLQQDSTGKPTRPVALSDTTAATLTRARVEATILRHRQITPGHVALALARDPGTLEFLQRRGVSSAQILLAVMPRLRCEA